MGERIPESLLSGAKSTRQRAAGLGPMLNSGGGAGATPGATLGFASCLQSGEKCHWGEKPEKAPPDRRLKLI